MFDQNWLKRYMLSTRPQGADDTIDPSIPKASDAREPDSRSRVPAIRSSVMDRPESDSGSRGPIRSSIMDRPDARESDSGSRGPNAVAARSSTMDRPIVQPFDEAAPGFPRISSRRQAPVPSFSSPQPLPAPGYSAAAEPVAVASTGQPLTRNPSFPATVYPGSQQQEYRYYAPTPGREQTYSWPSKVPENLATPPLRPPGGMSGRLPDAMGAKEASPQLPPPLPSWPPQPVAGGLYNSSGPFIDGGPGALGVPTPFGLWNYGNEGGMKYYVVMCKDDVEVRASPTYADDARIGHFLHPGQVIVVDDRRMVNGSWFVHLADGRGWVFETKERLLVMTQAQDFERGLWHYSVVCDDDVETRISPTYSDDSRTGLYLASGDCIAVDERCLVAGARFLKLADGRGWVFETKDRLLVMSEVRAKPQEARDFERGLWHYTVVCDDDVEIRAAPTYSDEARTGLMIHPGDCVAIDERCRVASVWYLRLADGRGWVFETKDARRVMMQMH